MGVIISDGVVLTGSGGSQTVVSGSTIVSFTIAAGQTYAFAGAGGAALYGPSPTIWNVINFGLITATGADSAGLRLMAGGTVTNGSAGNPTADINGTLYGVDIRGGAGRVQNNGTVSSSPNYGNGAGVQLLQGGTVINGATNLTSALITGGQSGAVYSNGGTTDLVINQATILGLGPTYGIGVQLRSGGTVVNGALNNTTALISSPHDGVVAVYGQGVVVNDATILGTPAIGASSYGVFLNHGGTVINGEAGDTKALIAGTNFGVSAQTLAATVTNRGTIIGTLGAGVTFNAGGIVSNASSGLIESDGTAVAVAGSAGTIINSGTIEGSPEDYASTGVVLSAGGTVANTGSIGGGAYGIDLKAGGFVTNDIAGIITGTNKNAIGAFATAATVINSGTIAGYDNNWSAIYLQQGGTVINQSTGLVRSSAYHAIDVINAPGTLINQGVIRSRAQNYAAAVAFDAGGLVDNRAGALISSAYYTALSISGTPAKAATVINAGRIEAVAGGAASSAYGAGVYIDNGGFVTNLASGVVSSQYRGVYGYDGAVTLTNAGTIQALDANGYAALLAYGYNNRVIVDPGAVFTGTVAIAGSARRLLATPQVVESSQAAMASGTLEFAAGPAAGTLSGVGSHYVGFQQITIDAGASWTMTGTNTVFPGQVLLDSGTLTNAGHLISAGTYDGLSLTKGTVAIAGSLVNGGTVDGGITLTGGAGVNNLSSGAIYSFGAYSNAIYGFDGNNTVLNAGYIGEGGIRLVGGGTVTNLDGLIYGFGNNPATGTAVYITGGAGSVYNTGSIGGGVGVRLDNGGVITNADSGIIGGYDNAVRVNSYAATLANAGTIASLYADALEFYATGNITNATGGTIEAVYGSAIKLQSGTIINDGLIAAGVPNPRPSETQRTAALQSAYAAYNGINEYGGVTIVNMVSGIIGGVFAGVLVHYGDATVTNAGTILTTDDANAVFLAEGYQNRVIDKPGAVFIGTVQAEGRLAEGMPAIADAAAVRASQAGGTLELASGTQMGEVTGVGTQFLNFGSITFDTGSQWLLSGDTAGLTGGQIISGFAIGDTIQITGLTETIEVYSNGTLTLGGDDPLSLILPGNYTTAEFVATAVPSGTDITLMCFAKGTRIATPEGDVAVETLMEGDVVLTQQGETKPVVWVGYRHVDCTQHPKPKLAWPVRVRAGAFGPKRPARDLWLSPDHCVYINGVMIPVKHLINDSTIAQVPVRTVTYYHVELPRHEVLLAEGLPVESYLDTDGRSNFANGGGVVRLFPDFASLSDDTAFLWEALGRAPRQVVGPEVEATRLLLARRAGRLAATPRTRHHTSTA